MSELIFHQNINSSKIKTLHPYIRPRLRINHVSLDEQSKNFKKQSSIKGKVQIREHQKNKNKNIRQNLIYRTLQLINGKKFYDDQIFDKKARRSIEMKEKSAKQSKRQTLTSFFVSRKKMKSSLASYGSHSQQVKQKIIEQLKNRQYLQNVFKPQTCRDQNNQINKQDTKIMSLQLARNIKIERKTLRQFQNMKRASPISQRQPRIIKTNLILSQRLPETRNLQILEPW